MDAPFYHSRLKIDRAEQHVEHLAQMIDEYAKLEPQYTIQTTKDNYVHFEIYRTAAPPRFLPAIVGDAIHNLRTSLDVMACEVVRLNKDSDKGVYFPFADSPEQLEEAIKSKKMNRASTEAIDLVRQLKPYRGGNTALRAVHDLDIQDKHQGIILQISQLNIPGIGLGMADNKIGKLTHGSSLVREGVPPQNGKFPIPVKFYFHHMSDLADHEVLKTLHGLTKEFRGIIDAFELCCLGTVSK